MPKVWHGSESEGTGTGSSKFVRGRVLCGSLMGGRGGPKVVLILLIYFFWLASIVSVIHRVNVFKNPYPFQVERVIPSPRSS